MARLFLQVAMAVVVEVIKQMVEVVKIVVEVVLEMKKSLGWRDLQRKRANNALNTRRHANAG